MAPSHRALSFTDSSYPTRQGKHLLSVNFHPCFWVLSLGMLLNQRIEKGSPRSHRCNNAVNKQATDCDLMLLFFLPYLGLWADIDDLTFQPIRAEGLIDSKWINNVLVQEIESSSPINQSLCPHAGNMIFIMPLCYSPLGCHFMAYQ